MSRFTTGVTVVTARDSEGGIVGMTANSFTSVSLSPPTVLISIGAGRTNRAIRQSSRFGVNVLPASGSNLSNHFAGRSAPGFEPEFETGSQMPKLRGIAAFFDCRIEKVLEVNDHTLLIGTVLACEHSDADPLVFYSSQYHGLGAELV